MSLKFNDSGQYKCWTQAWPWLTELQCARIKNLKVERKIEDEMHVGERMISINILCKWYEESYLYTSIKTE
jgi:hypothetical protein